MQTLSFFLLLLNSKSRPRGWWHHEW